MMGWLLLLVVLVAALLYWLFILSEGVYLGRRVVVWLYDRDAAKYDRIKGFDPDDDEFYLARPLIERLGTLTADHRPPTASPQSEGVVGGRSPAVVLDVATGTGRLPLALLAQPDFTGSIVALDASRKMLDIAREKLAQYTAEGQGGRRAEENEEAPPLPISPAPLPRVTLLYHNATRLPFPDASFDAVTCLEALEFLPDPRAALSEMARVLRPGGVLLVSLRVGTDRLFYPRRAPSLATFQTWLAAVGLTDIEPQVWQTYYSLVWAVKRASG